MFNFNSPEYQAELQAMREKQQQKDREDLKTNRKRRLTVTLTDNQMDELQELAKKHKVSVDAILSNYIADLLGTFDNGSDERELASRYFQRTWIYWNNEE